MQVQDSNDEKLELEQNRLNHIHSAAHFSWWHNGWIIVDVSTPHFSEFLSPPVLFRNMEWDVSNKTLLLHTHSLRSGLTNSPSPVQIEDVADISVRVLSIRPPIRLLRIDTETGNTTIIRLQLHLDLRRAHGRVAETCVHEPI